MTKLSIGIVTFPISTAGTVPTSNLIDILYSISKDIYLITGNQGYDYFKNDKRIKLYGVMHRSGSNIISRIFKYIFTQLKISYKLLKIVKNSDIWIFYIGGNNLTFPMMVTKLSKKKALLAYAGSSFNSSTYTKNNLSAIINFLENINCFLSNSIILHSANLIEDWNLERFRNKILIAHEYFLDLEKFKIKNNLENRSDLIGYIGRFSIEKGILNFVEAIDKISKKRSAVKFIIGGDGHLFKEIQDYLNKKNLNQKVNLIGWITHDQLPEYLNKLKLLVIPSYTESGPVIALEAMACGTPILGTKVGQILNMIKDGETGFIMENNSPECIVKNVERALDHLDLQKVVKNAREFVENEFTYNIAANRYREILTNLIKESE